MSKELPQYQSHKKVRALQIKAIHPGTGRGVVPGATLHFEEGYDPLPRSEKWMSKFDPQEGGYYVEYEDGYSSYSPADAFEGGYTLIREEGK